MTPLHITMLLHYHAIATPYAEHDPAHANSEAVREYRQQLLKWGLIQEDDNSGSGYSTTDKGIYLVEYICNLPLPTPKTDWHMH